MSKESKKYKLGNVVVVIVVRVKNATIDLCGFGLSQIKSSNTVISIEVLEGDGMPFEKQGILLAIIQGLKM